MLDPCAIAGSLGQLAPGQLRPALEGFLLQEGGRDAKISAIEAGLRSPLGQSLRQTMAQWIVDEIVPVERLVPEAYVKWRPPVRDAMIFVVGHLSAARLAPKLLEQIELPASTPPETRLLRLIAKVPGLQKLGQVIARNQHLHPALRNALAKLENGIRDIDVEQIRTIVKKQLGSRIESYTIEIAPAILKEASVSSVVRFTWKSRQTGRRERGVFKVLKPHIPEYFAEDMDYLQGLADYFGDRHHTYGFPRHLIPDTFRKVRRLLRHEVNFVREQKTLMEASELYRSFPKIRVPAVIKQFCTPTLTALTEVRGIKVTSAAARMPASKRRRVAEQLVEALIAVPLFSAQNSAVFHGDPHAGNLLYDRRTGTLAIVDWALRERLDSEQRRHLALLFLMVTLRDPVGACTEITALSQKQIGASSPKGRLVRQAVAELLDGMPPSHVPSAADVMRLLESVAVKGLKFPGSLIMLSKVVFTLDGILGDIVGADTAIAFPVARQFARHWIANRSEFRSPLTTRDWVMLQCSAMLFPSRLGVQWEQTMLSRWLKPNPGASPAAT